MDDASRRRRQNEAPVHPASSSRYQQTLQDSSQQRRSIAGTSSERYRPAPVNTSPSATARGMGGSASYSGYYQEPAASAFSASAMPQTTMGYHQPSEYGQDARQTQSFAGGYNATAMMYNVPQTGTQSTVYDTSQQFSSRQPAALQMMAPDVAGQYFPSEPANPAAAAASAMQPQAASSGTPSAVYQQAGADRSALLPNYSTGMTALGSIAGQSSPADVSMEDQEYPATGGLDEAYASYQSALKEIFQNIRNGVLAAASESLLNVSDWLLSHVAELGLTSDDQSLHSDRIKLWNDFNHAWMAILQRQKELMEPGQHMQRSQTVISRDGLEKMGNELVRLSDGIERHGLVDYQYGVWEELIISVLIECVDQYGSDDESPGAAASADSQQ